MKTIKTLATLIAVSAVFIFSAGCSKDDPKPEKAADMTEEQQFKAALMGRSWTITRYEYKDDLNPSFPLRDFYNDSVHTRKSTVDPDPCGWSGTTTSPMGIWKSYQVTFAASSVAGTFAYDLREVDWDSTVTNTNGCRIGYKTTGHTDVVTSGWSYNPSTKTLTISFGEPYNILDGQQEFFEMEYKVVSFDANKIELQGKKYYEGELFLTNNITLE
jgi:hypothetical protein